jgi:hypothetical protein
MACSSPNNKEDRDLIDRLVEAAKEDIREERIP